MTSGSVYGPSKQALSGTRLDDTVKRALRLREHLWVASALWAVADPASVDPVLLDKESLLAGPLIGCFICENPYTERLARRRCSGQGHDGPAPLLPGRR